MCLCTQGSPLDVPCPQRVSREARARSDMAQTKQLGCRSSAPRLSLTAVSPQIPAVVNLPNEIGQAVEVTPSSQNDCKKPSPDTSALPYHCPCTPPVPIVPPVPTTALSPEQPPGGGLKKPDTHRVSLQCPGYMMLPTGSAWWPSTALQQGRNADRPLAAAKQMFGFNTNAWFQ